MRRRDALLALAAICVPKRAFPSMWIDVDVTCPVCGTTNVFKKPGSWGSYVYRDPSRFQYVFWPANTDTFLYTCRRCHLTAYMQDFDSIPPARIADLAALLEREGAIAGAVLPYYDIPMPERLRIAAKVYELLGRDRAFWCEFYRISGYHLAESGAASEAHAARRRALEEAEALLAEAPDTTRKEAHVIVGSMRFFTGDVPGARQHLDRAEGLTFSGPIANPQGLDEFLGQLIADFRSELLAGPEPR